MQAGTKQTSSNSSANTIQLQAAKLLLFQTQGLLWADCWLHQVVWQVFGMCTGQKNESETCPVVTLNKKISHHTERKGHFAIYSILCPPLKRKYTVVSYTHTLLRVYNSCKCYWTWHHRERDMGDSTTQTYFQSKGDTHSQTSQSAEMQRCGTFNLALYSQLHMYIREDLEQSRKRKQLNRHFSGWILWGAATGIKLLEVSVKFRQGRPLGISLSKGSIPGSIHLTQHTPQHMPAVRCKP